MSTVVSTNRLEPAQHTAAKVVGFLYLFTMATAIFSEFYVRGQLIVRGDAGQTARNIVAHERLFRIGIAGELIMIAGVVILQRRDQQSKNLVHIPVERFSVESPWKALSAEQMSRVKGIEAAVIY